MNELKLFYEGILNHSPGDIFVFDDKGFLIYCNKPSSEWKCWWDPSQGQSIFDSEFPFTHRQKLIIQAIQLSIAQQSVVRVEDVFEDGSGDTSYFLQSILPYLNTHQTLEHIIISGVEITEQKKNEHVLQTKNAELKKINAELDSFVYSISHDLRSPLLSIKGILALVLSNEGLDPSSVQFLKMAEDSVGRLDGTIQEILEYSRNSRLELEKSSVHVAQMIQEILDDLQFSHDLPHAWKVMAEGVGEISTDKARLKVLLRNIIGNSVKYRREGVVNEVEVKVNLDHGRVYFEVKDNGEGITQESIKRVFDMFYRGTTNSQGTGLGLYICKEIIGKLGGEISIESEKGVGTSVYFWIPLND